MGYFIDGYKIMGKEITDYVANNKAQIAGIASVCGTLVSNILSTKAGAKSARLIDAKAAEIGRELTIKEKVELCWKNHISSGIVMTGSMASGIYSNNKHVKNFNAAANAYGALKKLYDSSKKATKEVLGEKKAAELDGKLAQKMVDENPEIKQKIQSTPNVNPSVTRKFYEPVSGEVIVTTYDKLSMAFHIMKTEMEALKPRANRASIHGIKLLRLFDLLDHPIPQAKRESDLFRYYGFNKGGEENNKDDDEIDAYFTPMIIDDETMDTAAMINWKTSPSDMRMGSYMKF